MHDDSPTHGVAAMKESHHDGEKVQGLQAGSKTLMAKQARGPEI